MAKYLTDEIINGVVNFTNQSKIREDIRRILEAARNGDFDPAEFPPNLEGTATDDGVALALLDYYTKVAADALFATFADLTAAIDGVPLGDYSTTVAMATWLSDYMTETEFGTALADYTTSVANTLIYQPIITPDSSIDLLELVASEVYDNSELQAVADKLDVVISAMRTLGLIEEPE